MSCFGGDGRSLAARREYAMYSYFLRDGCYRSCVSVRAQAPQLVRWTKDHIERLDC